MDNYKETADEETIDIKNLIYKFLGKWHWFVACLAVALVIAFYVNRFSQRTYEIKTSVLIKDEKSVLDDRFSAIGMDNTQYKISNEIGVLKSYQMTQRALLRLDFQTDYFLESRFYAVDLYKSSPFIVVIDTSVTQPVQAKFFVSFTSEDEFDLTIDEENVGFYDFKEKKYTGTSSHVKFKKHCKLFEKITTKDFSFIVIPHSNENRSRFIGEKLSFAFNTPESLIGRYRNFSVTSDKSSSIISISIKGTNVSRMVDFANTLTNEYLQKGVERKNLIAENTIKFIDSQVGEISDSLNYSETKLQNYRSQNRVMNVDFQAQQAISALEELKNQRAEILVKSRYYDYLKQYLTDNNDGQNLAAPSSMGINDPVLNSLISELLKMFNDRLEMMYNSKKENPYIASMDIRIKSMKQNINENVENLRNATNISLQDIDQRISQVSERVNKLPETQRQLFGFERQFKLNDALYTYLLTKRSEMQIAKAAYLPDNEVLDIARDSEYSVISPNTRRNFIIAFFLGLGIPLAFFLLKDYLNDKVSGNEDVEKITDLPILGHIIRNKSKSKTAAFDNPMCLTAESIRSIRANFQFVANEKKSNVVLVTSSMMSEGKSFTSINLALSFAQNNKRCVILCFDLRKPKIKYYLNIDSDKGVSSFLSSDIDVDDVTNKAIFPNLDVITAGPVPPNPMELISGDRTKQLFDQLKLKYDYIFVDTPPIGMVADAILLLKYSDVNIYVVRHNWTLKKMLSNVVSNIRKRGITNFNIIINDIPAVSKLRGYSQAYGYGAYSYYSSNERDGLKQKERNIFRQLINKTGLWL